MKKQMKKLILLCTLVVGISLPAAAYAEKADNAELSSGQKESYANEWVQGKWYGRNGAQTYKGIGSWHKNSKGWWYEDTRNWYPKNQWQKIDGKWYYFNAAGYMATGWRKLAGIWYYLNPSGAMATGWKKIKGAWYYFDELGRMYSNSYIDKKYFVDENGRWDGVTIEDVPEDEYVPQVGNVPGGEDVPQVGSVPGGEDVPQVGNVPGGEDVPQVGGAEPMQDNGQTTLTFHQDGWYVARLEVQVWDRDKQNYIWLYSDSCAKGQKMTLDIDTGKYEINRVGYQIWFFGWDNDYMNLPWANTNYATDFTLSGAGDYPELSWK